jgi:hypothetical protein
MGMILDSLPDPHRKAVEEQLGKSPIDGGLSDITLSVALRDSGLRIGKTTINLHRRKLCECERRN